MDISVQPEKEFFVHMLTKDILLQDCILDLLDNSVDGVNEYYSRKKKDSIEEASRYKDFKVDIALDQNKFEIRDNCGGITLKLAKERAFKLGMWKEIHETGHTIGLYGIGMKRAMFKMGTKLTVKSSTEEEGFRVQFDVNEWLVRKNDWTIPLDEVEPGRNGTLIRVESLYTTVSADFGLEKFANDLRYAIARDYFFILQKGLVVKVNGAKVEPIDIQFLQRSSGAEKLFPCRIAEKVDDVRVEIVAGMTALPPEDDSADAPARNAELFGWYVVCNDRVVLAGDKTIRTGWGDGARVWHPQYAGFIGVARFSARAPGALPWTTTKRDIEPRNKAYQRALVLMKDVAKAYAQYTTRRKVDLPKAKSIEAKAALIPFSKVQKRESMQFPRLAPKAKPLISISYSRPRQVVDQVAACLGDREMSAKLIGEHTFDYYYAHEVKG